MINVIASVRRKAGMTHQEYLQYIEQEHGRIAREKPLTIRKYLQNHVIDSAFGAANDSEHQLLLPRDSVTELYFDDLSDMGRCFSDPYAREKVAPDGRNFADLATTQSMISTTQSFAVTNPGASEFKVLHFIRRQGSLPLADFFKRWSAAHADAAASVTTQLRGYTQHRQLPEANAVLAHFGGDTTPPYEGVAAMWFDGDGPAAFRRYQQALEAQSSGDNVFMNVSQSYFLFVREVAIFDFTAA